MILRKIVRGLVELPPSITALLAVLCIILGLAAGVRHHPILFLIGCVLFVVLWSIATISDCSRIRGSIYERIRAEALE